MFSRWFRAGVRTQVIIMMLIGAVLTTGVTLLIADASIQGYGIQQAQAQESRNLNVALLVLHKQFGASVSIDAANNLVLDSPTLDTKNFTDPNNPNGYGKLELWNSSAYVDSVQALLSNNAPTDPNTAVQISVYQCATNQNDPKLSLGRERCPRISTTLNTPDSNGNPIRQVDGSIVPSANDVPLRPQVYQLLGLHSTTDGLQASATSKTIQETLDGIQYLSAYKILNDPEGHLIGVLSVSEPLTTINALINRTTLELIISGVVIMLGGIILALLVASTISGTLQRAATQLGAASSQLTGIADNQAAGSHQQVWAINAINQALQNLQETSNDVSQRTDQLAQIGTQVAMRRAEIAPAQFESIMAYMTRSAGDISVASRHQTTTIERMSSAMEAVVEIADQVSGSSQQTTESAKRLDGVIGELEELVSGKASHARRAKKMQNDQPTMSGGMNSGQMNSGNMGSGQMRGGQTNNGQMPNGQMRGGQMNNGQMPMRDMGMPMSSQASRPRPSANGQMPMGAPGQMAGPNAGYTMQGQGRSAPNNGPAMGRPMLPSGDPSQSRPRMRDQGEGWGRTGEQAPSSSNYPSGYGEQSPWPNPDQGRNQR